MLVHLLTGGLVRTRSMAFNGDPASLARDNIYKSVTLASMHFWYNTVYCMLFYYVLGPT